MLFYGNKKIISFFYDLLDYIDEAISKIVSTFRSLILMYIFRKYYFDIPRYGYNLKIKVVNYNKVVLYNRDELFFIRRYHRYTSIKELFFENIQDISGIRIIDTGGWTKKHIGFCYVLMYER